MQICVQNSDSSILQSLAAIKLQHATLLLTLMLSTLLLDLWTLFSNWTLCSHFSWETFSCFPEFRMAFTVNYGLAPRTNGRKGLLLLAETFVKTRPKCSTWAPFKLAFFPCHLQDLPNLLFIVIDISDMLISPEEVKVPKYAPSAWPIYKIWREKTVWEHNPKLS